MLYPVNTSVIICSLQRLTPSLIMPSNDREKGKAAYKCSTKAFTSFKSNSRYIMTKGVFATCTERLSHVYLYLSVTERIKNIRI